jgi:hypothetical protein
MRYLIATYTNPGDLVVDSCAGSGPGVEAATQRVRAAERPEVPA